jgi:intracellular sulfur oxidation DsrE/DsrF family protein
MFLTRLGASAAAFGLSDGVSAAPSAAGRATGAQEPSSAARFEPARHTGDDWLELPGKHRFFFDSLSPKGVEEAQLYAGNFIAANKNGYGLETSDLAVVICMRHLATPFAFNDAVWTKYGALMSQLMDFTDPKTKKPPVVNIHDSGLAEAIKNGVHFAVCDMATHYFAEEAAKKMNSTSDAVYKELAANTVGNCHFVPAGIVAVNRAQERGYSIAYVG